MEQDERRSVCRACPGLFPPDLHGLPPARPRRSGSRKPDQDTFLTAYRAIGRFQGEHYKPWLVRIAVNKAKDHLKSAGHALTEPAELEMLDAYPSASSPAAETESRETVALIRKACEELPEPYRQVALLRFLEDKSYEEIAAALGRPLKTVQTQGLRAREKLRRTLKEVL